LGQIGGDMAELAGEVLVEEEDIHADKRK